MNPGIFIKPFFLKYNKITNKINPFRPDRSHFHHILLRRKLSPIKTLAIIFFSSIFLNMFGLTIFIFFGPMPSLVCFVSLLMLYIFININIEKKLE